MLWVLLVLLMLHGCFCCGYNVLNLVLLNIFVDVVKVFLILLLLLLLKYPEYCCC